VAAGARIRAFVTGGSGFAGQHLIRHLTELGASVSAPAREELDLREAAAVRAAVERARPERVFHLAALASVSRSWEDTSATVLGNVEMTLNVLEAVKAAAPSARALHAGSGEVYGKPEQLPVTEDAPLRPQNPYAVSKAACDLIAGQYADAHGLSVVRTRAFNHAGPGQSADYVVGTLTRQVAEAERAGAEEVVLRTGNPDARRDFTDVRDVVRAYSAAIDLEGGTYNVASGRTASVRDLIALMEPLTDLSVRHEVESARLRPTDVPEIHGSAERLREATGWTPEYPLERTVADALDRWRVELQ
jgi:GDP-4-dehydro-6-deoxy-D-mannose reductase